MTPQLTVLEYKLDREVQWLDKALRELERQGGKSVAESVWKYSQMFAATLVARTRPKTSRSGGGAKKGVDMGEKAVSADIRRAYREPREVFQLVMREQSINAAKAFWHHLKNGTQRDVEGFLRSAGGTVSRMPVAAQFDGGAHHHRVRVTGSGRTKNGMVKASAGVMVMDWASVRPYIKKIQDRVFFAKGAWVSDFKPPGGIRGIPLEARRHRNAPGRVIEKMRNTTSPTLEFQNHVDYIGHVFFEGDFLGSVRWINNVLAKDIEKQIIKAAQPLTK